MDNDSTTMARIHATVDPSIQKKTDTNHTKKALISSLYGLSIKHKYVLLCNTDMK